MKKLLCGFLVSSLLVLSSTPVSAFTNDYKVSSPAIINKSSSSQALASTTGEDAPEKLKAFLEENGLEITDDSLIEILPQQNTMERTSKENVLSVTTVAGNTLERDIIIIFNKDDNNTVVPASFEPSDLNNVQSRDSEMASYETAYFTVRGTGVFDRYYKNWMAFYNPYGCYFIYTKNQNCNVSKASVSFISEGGQLSYPSFQELDLPVIKHVVRVDRYNPTPSTQYNAINYYSANETRVLNIASGSPSVGMCLTFDLVVDGQNWNRTILVP